jgi:hypothetical protein
MNKLKILSNHLKSSGLKDEYSAMLKLSQMQGKDPSYEEILNVDEPISSDEDIEEQDDYAGFRGKLEEWMSGISPKLKITTSKNKIDSIKDFSGACTVGHKPKGIWYSSGPIWLNWLKVEMPGWLNESNYIYNLVPKYSDGLYSRGGVLQLKTEQDIRDFSWRCAKLAPGGIEVAIDWAEVARRFDGIEIIPYQHGLRYDETMPWYYGWDVGSGCIWRESGVSEFSLLRKKPGLKE